MRARLGWTLWKTAAYCYHVFRKFKMADGSADGHLDKEECDDKDPLSFFTAGDSSSSSDSESESDVKDDKQDKLKSNSSGANVSALKTKLPSPTTLFATVGRPAFLETKEESYVDWNSLSKRYEPNTYSAPPVQFSTVTESRESEEYEDAVISSAPVKYGKEMSDIQKHLVIHEKRSVATALNILKERGEMLSSYTACRSCLRTHVFFFNFDTKISIGSAEYLYDRT